MKIYQVIECGGQYEDAYEDVRGTFLKEENAKAYLKYSKRTTEMIKESVDRQLAKCSRCYDIFEDVMHEDDFIKVKNSANSNCPRFKNLEFINECLECEHYDETYDLYRSDDFNCRFILREFEVLDS